MNRTLATILTALLLVVAITGCNRRQNQLERVITVTIEPLRFFTEQIAKEKFRVQTMVTAGNSPETYEPTARQMIDVSESAIYIKVGNLGFENSWLQRISENAKSMKIVDSSKGISKLASDKGYDDPHTWMSTKNACIIARNILEALCKTSPKDSAYFKANYKTLLQQIDNVDNAIKSEMKGKDGKCFLVYHPILTYFASEYRLRQIALEHEGHEPSANQMKATLYKAKSMDAKTFFTQKEFANNGVETIAKNLGITTSAINPLGYDWPSNMKEISHNLK